MGHTKRIYDSIMRLWPLYKIVLWMGKQPGIGRLIRPVFSSKIHQMSLIPVNEAITQRDQIVLPYSLLNQFVEQSTARFIMAECVCRSHDNCQSHPVNIGCLFLGDGAAQIHPHWGDCVTLRKPKSIYNEACRMGLSPLIAHTLIDAVTLGIPYKRMLTICFCCECCCAVYRGMRQGPEVIKHIIQRLPGIIMTVRDECIGCGACIDRCPVGAISFNHRGVEIREECKGCGICVNACQYGAIMMEISGEVELLTGFRERMKSYASISSQ